MPRNRACMSQSDGDFWISRLRWHFLYFFPEPHQQGSFRLCPPIVTTLAENVYANQSYGDLPSASVEASIRITTRLGSDYSFFSWPMPWSSPPVYFLKTQVQTA